MAGYLEKERMHPLQWMDWMYWDRIYLITHNPRMQHLAIIFHHQGDPCSPSIISTILSGLVVFIVYTHPHTLIMLLLQTIVFLLLHIRCSLLQAFLPPQLSISSPYHPLHNPLLLQPTFL